MLSNNEHSLTLSPSFLSHCTHSFMMEYDIHTVLDFLTLAATGIIVYCMTQTDIALTYQKEQDKVQFYYVVRVWLCNCSQLASMMH